MQSENKAAPAAPAAAPAKAPVAKNKSGKNIYDADGDGIEDVRYPTYDELDRYYIPNVFGHAEDLYNTLNGEPPGHEHKAFDDTLTEPQTQYDLIKISSLQH
jgi:hypothetical protein